LSNAAKEHNSVQIIATFIEQSGYC